MCTCLVKRCVFVAGVIAEIELVKGCVFVAGVIIAEIEQGINQDWSSDLDGLARIVTCHFLNGLFVLMTVVHGRLCSF